MEIQISKIRNENRDISIDSIGIKIIVKDYYEQLYDNILDNLK